MKNLLRKVYRAGASILPKKLRRNLEKIKLGIQLTTYDSSYLVRIGYVDSRIDKELKDKNGEFLPWMNYSAVDFLKERLDKSIRVFEYGSGASTMFFAERCKEVISIEYDREWYDKISRELDNFKNAMIRYYELNDDYPRAIGDFGNDKFDLIIIDGRKRVKSAIAAFDKLSDSGVLLLDDSFRGFYSDAIDFYHSKGFKSLIFKGIKPTGFEFEQSTLFYREGNCLGI